MIVYGYTVPLDVIAALVDYMRVKRTFHAAMLITEAARLGVPLLGREDEAIANRVVDRLLQTKRRQGEIEFKRSHWHWRGSL